ncbi:hypothetical protein DM02DRAFT_637297 [Periconia macrospinosa]|uniref:BHLH domain-containing protein n=1 Tax=Periconia macrospinosa TaxID=97972 RepID=A0A2V1EET0_9PLEO|nr:hypothetical protein DM02DRAFT_637297 [Periconia macrospinosa]
MPRTSFPPTPAPSTDITAKKSTNAVHLDSSFTLPPAAIANTRSTTSASTDTSSAASNASDSSYRPLSPASPVATSKNASNSRKRQSAGHGAVSSADYSLPPPPTRSRKIIQMKPKEAQELPNPTPTTTTAKPPAAPPATGKKKQPGTTTAAGRKIARKTAHSLIERRRRSKMNEEFGVLKDMIPACAGQEMHKLAILQASIEYMRYLQQCVDELKEAHRSSKPMPSTTPSPYMPHTEPSGLAFEPNAPMDEEDEDDQEEEDEDMSDAVSPKHAPPIEQESLHSFPNASPAIYPSDRSIHSTTTSPNLGPNDIRNYSAAISPALQPSDPHRYSLGGSCIRSTATSPSIQPSPAFSGRTPSQTFRNPFPAAPSSRKSVSGTSGGVFALTSPALGPQTDREDHEATEALLMLNTDRRSWNGEKNASGRGMSVRDLLSG